MQVCGTETNGSMLIPPYTVTLNASSAGSTSMQTRLGVQVVGSKFNIVRLPVETTLFAFGKTVNGPEQRGSGSLHIADSLITNF